MENLLNIAKAMAMSTPGIKRFKHGAVLFDKRGRIINAKGNLRKTHPLLLKFTSFPYLHAESHAILGNGLDNCVDLKLLVVRCSPTGTLRNSSPCPTCRSIIRQVGIKHIYYSNDEGTITHEVLF